MISTSVWSIKREKTPRLTACTRYAGLIYVVGNTNYGKVIMSLLNAYAEFQVVDCDWCGKETKCRSLFNGDVWVMSVCAPCEKSAFSGGE